MSWTHPTPMTRRALLGASLAAGLVACSGEDKTTSATSTSTASASGAAGSAASPTPTPTPQLELPRGGRTLFPSYRLFGYSGQPGAPGQGRLGIGDLDERVIEMEKRAAPYAKGRKIMPIMELIATTVHGSAGKDGMYRSRTDDAVIQEWLTVARKHKAMLLLNIQPGRSSFPVEVKAFEKWLTQPDVGLALDPEWRMGPGEVPMKTFGHVTAQELNETAAWVSDLVAEHGLPEKVMVFHQLNPGVVRNEKALKPAKGVVMIKSVDGIGGPGAKIDTYQNVVKTMPAFVHAGFKLFYQEDVQTGGRLMTPAEVMGLKPVPEYVLFE
ncbi:hypothetical protein [Luteococcus peritonei]|uniref:Lipoprotein n=1 Tax=Luteococcus peritonei TaxID=88874 RepID=A0ABW4RVS2_9ACTN